MREGIILWWQWKLHERWKCLKQKWRLDERWKYLILEVGSSIQSFSRSKGSQKSKSTISKQNVQRCWAHWKELCFFINTRCIVYYCIILYRIVSYRIVSYCIVLYCILLFCIVLYCIVLYCIVLYCTVEDSEGFSKHASLTKMIQILDPEFWLTISYDYSRWLCDCDYYNVRCLVNVWNTCSCCCRV